MGKLMKHYVYFHSHIMQIYFIDFLTSSPQGFDVSIEHLFV